MPEMMGPGNASDHHRGFDYWKPGPTREEKARRRARARAIWWLVFIIAVVIIVAIVSNQPH